MAKRILIIILLISLLIIPTIFANSIPIKIKTKPYHKILVSTYKAGITPPEIIKSFAPYKNTSSSGELTLTLITSERKVDIKLDLKKDDKNVVTHEFYDVDSSGDPISINLFPPDNMTVTTGNPDTSTTVSTAVNNSNATNVTNITVNNVSNVAGTNITAAENKAKSNFSISGSTSQFFIKNSKTLLYILIVIAVIVGIFIIIFIIKKMPKKIYHPGPAPIYHRHNDESSDRPLAEAERKLKIAQEEIEKIKSHNQALRDAERRLDEDRLRLDKLRRGY